MNVYVVELAKRLAAAGVEVEIFTRATSSDLPPVVEMAPGVHRAARHRRPVRGAGQGRPARRSCARSPAACCAPRRAARRATTTSCTPTTGSPARSAGWPRTAGACRWCTRRTRWPRSRTPLLADGDKPEPIARVIGEEQVVAAADRLVANTADRGRAADRASTAPTRAGSRSCPRASTWTCSRPRRHGAAASAGSACPQDALVLAVRRPDPAAQGARRAAARRRRAAAPRPGAAAPARRRGRAAARAGTGLDRPTRCTDLAAELGIADCVRFVPPAPQDELAELYRAADLVAVPSLQRVVRPGRDRGAGLRHPGRRGRRRRPDAPPCATASPACWSTATTRPTGPRRSATLLAAPGRRRASSSAAPCAHAARVLLDARPPTRPARRYRDALTTLREAPSCARGRCHDPDGTARPTQVDRGGRCDEREIELREDRRQARYVVALPGTAQAEDHLQPHRRRARAAASRRSSCGTPTRTARQLWQWLLQRNARMYGVAFSVDARRRRLPDRPAAAARGHRGGARPAPRRGADLRRRVASTRCWRSASARRSGASGPGGSSAASPWTISRHSRPSWSGQLASLCG